MIEKISLTNFKGFKTLQLHGLSRITLLGGENSVGKSSVLEALFLFFDRGNPELIVRQFGWRGMGRTLLSAEHMFSPIFHDYSLEKTVTIALTIDNSEERLTLNFSDKRPTKSVSKKLLVQYKSATTKDERPLVYGTLDLKYTHASKSEYSSLILSSKGLTLKDEDTKRERRPAVYISPRVANPPGEDAERFSRLDIKGEAKSATSFLNEFDSRIRDLSVIFYAESAIIHADVGLSQKVPVPQLGEGLSVMLTIFLAISAARDGIVLIDEVATGIHHSFLPRFWQAIARAARQFNCQIIGTTHSYECMQAAAVGLKELLEPEFTYIRLDRDGDETEPSIYTFPVLEAAIDSGWEVR
jgi:hypothetical protein